jgi:predicted PurR-regulated permease PerM
MTVGQQLRWWGGGLAVFALLFWLLADAVLPFLLGAAMAYLCDPLADRLERIGFSRLAATVAVTVAWLALGALALLLIVPLLAEQIRNAVASAPGYIDWLREVIARWAPAEGEPSQLRDMLEAVRVRANDWSVSALKGLWSGGLAVVDFVALVVITPVVAFYLLYDWDRMIAVIDDWLPREHRDTIHGLARELDGVLAGFVRGQLSVCAILGTFYAVALTVIGLHFGFLIGVFAGMISFVPFVGSILGGVLSIGVALVQFWNEPQFIAAVAAVFVTGQVVEGNYLTPKLVGGHVGLHPVWLMFALSAFGSLFGFVGMLVAVPAAAAIGVLGRFGLARYREGALYQGSTAWRTRQRESARGEGE